VSGTLRSAGESRRRTVLPCPTSQLARTYSNVRITETCAALPCVGCAACVSMCALPNWSLHLNVESPSSSPPAYFTSSSTFFLYFCRDFRMPASVRPSLLIWILTSKTELQNTTLDCACFYDTLSSRFSFHHNQTIMSDSAHGTTHFHTHTTTDSLSAAELH
jgi:ferredoxin